MSRSPGEQVLLDGNVEAEGHEFFSLGSFEITTDGHRMLYGVDVAGDERYTVRVRDLVTGEQLPDEIPDTFAGATFSPDGRFIVYTTVDDAWRPDTVWLHELGTPVDGRREALPRARRAVLARRRLHPQRPLPRDRHRLVDHLRGMAGRCRRPALRAAAWCGRAREGVEYDSSHAVIDGEDVLFILHNDGALDFELVQVAASDPTGPRDVVVPHRRGQRLLGVSTFRDWGVLGYRRGGLARLGMLDYATGAVSELEFDEPLYSVGSGGNPEWAPPLLRLGYGSFVTPGTVCDYEVATGELLLRKRQPVLGGYEPARLRAGARVGDARRTARRSRSRSCGSARSVRPALRRAPCTSTATGRTSTRSSPASRSPRLSELDRGVIFAVAHVRGGGEMGRQWYEDGKLLHKRNTFTDFVDCARHLVEQGYTSADRMVAEGGSAGGLLMGAVANLAPELFAGILADVPFVDALTTILDPSLPLTVIEWDEWGDPLHNADVYAYMKSYSPYENVRDGCRVPADPRRHLAQRHPRAVRRAREVGRAAARGRRGRAAQVRDGRRARRRERALQRVARARVRARLAAGRGRLRRLSPGIRRVGRRSATRWTRPGEVAPARPHDLLPDTEGREAGSDAAAAASAQPKSAAASS